VHPTEEYSVTIKTLRLSLDPMMASHASAMFPILSDQKLYKFTRDDPPESEKSLGERYRYLEGRQSPDKAQLWLNWLVHLEDDGTPIGYVQATVSETHADIAWLIGSLWQGNGYASEAALAMVQWLGENAVKTIRARINSDHLASQRVAENAGLSKSDLVEDEEDVWVLKVAEIGSQKIAASRWER
jgi:RimJ/RimL family protein N-acetyltransferase